MSEPLVPAWLRPAALTGVAAAHGLAALLLIAAPAPPAANDAPIEVSVAPLGDAPEDQVARPETAPEPEPAPQPTPSPTVAAPDPPPPVVAKPSPKPRPTIAAKPKPRATPVQIAERESPAEAESQRGAAQGAVEAKAAARVSYAAALAAEIARHKVYPPSAQARGVEGAVRVRLTVGPSGRVVSHALLNSSGDADLDAEVGAMLAAVAAPPPPDGTYSGALTIRFDLR